MQVGDVGLEGGGEFWSREEGMAVIGIKVILNAMEFDVIAHGQHVER